MIVSKRLCFAPLESFFSISLPVGALADDGVRTVDSEAGDSLVAPETEMVGSWRNTIFSFSATAATAAAEAADAISCVIDDPDALVVPRAAPVPVPTTVGLSSNSSRLAITFVVWCFVG
uniref:Putative secreted protein n=1 Tax=Anopheles triannulatus TaxID=58253 RepID=A0A2M4B2L6_9DIPT